MMLIPITLEWGYLMITIMNKIDNIKKLILGSAQMGFDYGINNINGKIDINESFEILKFAFLNGIKNIDCAEGYGNIHEILGIFKQSNPEIDFYINTKLSSTNSKIDCRKKVKKILFSLKQNKIQSIMFHSYSLYKENLDSIKDYHKMKEEGLIGSIGVSVYLNKEIKSLIHDDNIDLIQIPFNMLDNSKEKIDLIKEAKLNGKIIQARSVFLQGLFLKNPNDDNFIVKKLSNELNQLKSISINNKVPIYAMAMNYVMSQDFIDYVIIGVDNLLQLKKNIVSLNKTLDKKIINQINSINTKNKSFLNPTNWEKV